MVSFRNRQSLFMSAMGNTEEPSDKRIISPIISIPASDSAATNQPLLSSLIQTLEQTDSEGVASLERSIRTTIARRRRAFNDKNSPLLRLPIELLVMIAYLAIGTERPIAYLPDEEGALLCWPMPNWWTEFGTLMGISSRLRETLDTMRSGRATFGYTLSRSTNLVEKCRTIPLDLAYYRGVSHRGPALIKMSMNYYVGYSAAAALAAFLECLIFGRLQQPPVVYVESRYLGPDENGEGGDGKAAIMFPAYIWVGHARKLSLRVWEVIGYQPIVIAEGPISVRKAKAVWKRVEAARNRNHRKKQVACV
jgi:hypothetical protein